MVSLIAVAGGMWVFGATCVAAYWWVYDNLINVWDAEMWLIGPSGRVADRVPLDLDPGQTVVEHGDMAFELEGISPYQYDGKLVWLIDSDYGAPFEIQEANDQNEPLLNRMDGFDFYQARENQRAREFYAAQAADLQGFMDRAQPMLYAILATLALVVFMLAGSAGWIG